MSGTEIRRPPEKLQAGHEVSAFDCGEPVRNDWLRRRALQNQQSGASSTYVILDGMRVVGYYSLAAGSVARDTAPGRVRRNMPEPMPVVVLGRLAIDRAFQGGGLGRALLRDAVLRIMNASEIIGVRAILVHALSERAKHLYDEHGFAASPVNPSTLMVTVAAAMREFRRQGA